LSNVPEAISQMMSVG